MLMQFKNVKIQTFQVTILKNNYKQFKLILLTIMLFWKFPQIFIKLYTYLKISYNKC